LLFKRLQEVSHICAVFSVSFGGDYWYNSCACSVQALSLTAELQKTIGSSAKAVVSLHRALDLDIEEYNLLRDGNNSLLAGRNTLRD
jgi:hypothetical protein